MIFGICQGGDPNQFLWLPVCFVFALNSVMKTNNHLRRAAGLWWTIKAGHNIVAPDRILPQPGLLLVLKLMKSLPEQRWMKRNKSCI